MLLFCTLSAFTWVIVETTHVSLRTSRYFSWNKCYIWDWGVVTLIHSVVGWKHKLSSISVANISYQVKMGVYNPFICCAFKVKLKHYSPKWWNMPKIKGHIYVGFVVDKMKPFGVCFFLLIGWIQAMYMDLSFIYAASTKRDDHFLNLFKDLGNFVCFLLVREN